MLCLKETPFSVDVKWLGRVSHPEHSIKSEAVTSVFAGFAGFEGESHAGVTRPSCVRVRNLYEKGTEIGNVRQVTILSEEELTLMAGDMDLDQVDPTWLGASMVISGLPNLTLVPPSSRLQFSSGATLTIDMRNLPCNLPAAVIEKIHKNAGKKFKDAANNRRGVTAWVEREGNLSVGDKATLFVPSQPAWPVALEEA